MSKKLKKGSYYFNQNSQTIIKVSNQIGFQVFGKCLQTQQKLQVHEFDLKKVEGLLY